MEIGTILHGFEIINKRASEELGGTLYEMRHNKTGAQLIFLDNKADNKLFSVAFKTLPWDDTGVFHILEHSVLAGSENYPVKEPFLDLLKSSMNTFLNAMTFPDKTVYPVSSRNDQDFMNLVGVYLDAVFKPAIYYNESIFRQEGWHYELDENGNPFYNGVVFNEMKGALSSADGLIFRALTHYLFPDTPYGFESGGDPTCIPDLTYEDFLRAHREFYAPSNAKIYLDGDVPLERVLALMDEKYLNDAAPAAPDHEIAMQQPIAPKNVEMYYEIGKDESETEKTQFVMGKVFGDWQDRKRILAYTLLSSYLADSNESPLKRAILEKGLAQDVDFYVSGAAQYYFGVLFRNTDADKTDAIRATFCEVVQKILDEGIDREELSALMNRTEYEMREPEEPKGLSRNIMALQSWLYGGDAMLYLENNAVLADVRAAMDTDYFETILRELLDDSGLLTMTVLPSKTMGEEAAAAEKARVTAEYHAFSDEEKRRVAQIFEDMRTWQDTPDSPEAAATLPVLSLSDVSKTPLWTDTALLRGDVPVMFHQMNTNGIAHINLYFDASDADDELLSELALAAKLFSLLPTEHYTPQQLQKEINKITGELRFRMDTVSIKDEPLACKVYFAVNFSVLEQNVREAIDLVLEILTRSDFSRKDIIREILMQTKETEYQVFMSAGHMYAMQRVLRQTSAVYYAEEKFRGWDFYTYLSEFAADFDNRVEAYMAKMQQETMRLMTRGRLIAGETARQHFDYLDTVAQRLSQGEPTDARFCITQQPPQREQILIPAGVSFALYGAHISQYGYKVEGALNVASKLLTYGYLWNEIRVHGGAYGCGTRVGSRGAVSFYSYRDPNPLGSLEVYRNTSDFIRAFVASEESVDKYIISSIAATEALMSTSTMGEVADNNYLAGVTYEGKAKRRAQMLALKKEDLLSLCDLFDQMRDGNSICIVGNEKALADAGDGWIIHRL